MSTTGRRSASARASSITAGTVAPDASARVPAAWITGPSASGSENGHAELDEVGAAVGVGLADRPRRVEVGEAAHQVGHQRRVPVRGRERGRDPLDAGAHASSSAASASARSLSPRPERQIRSSSDGGAASTQATAWEDSSAGMIPSSLATCWNAASAWRSVTAS